jgi:recombination protein RecT
MNNQQITHVATAPNKKPATSLQAIKGLMGTAEYMKQITNYYRGDRDEALRFLTASVEYIRRVPKLLQCDSVSLLSALVQSAQFRFMPSGVMGEAYIIPYGTDAKFQLGYQGIVTLLYRTGKIVGITANIICENDHFDYEEGLEAHLIHKPAMFGKPKGDPIGVYTVVQMRGGAKTFKVMDKEAVMAIKEMSKAKDRAESPWNSKDPELWMWKKTCLIQHAKLLPKTQELQQAIEKDYEGEGIEKPAIDVAGPATGRANHMPEETNQPEAGEADGE